MSSAKRHIVLAAGGTGGHMAPADAVKDVLRERDFEVSLVTDRRGASISNMLQDVPRHILSAKSHQTGGLFGRAKAALSLIASYRETKRYLTETKPDLVVGFGGYPSLPAVKAAKARGVPFMLHEQNAVLGRVNRWSARQAERVLLSLEPTTRVPEGTKTCLVGNPVRTTVRRAAGQLERRAKQEAKTTTILILGGSQGARILSDLVPAALIGLATRTDIPLKVFQQVRPEDEARVSAAYEGTSIDAVIAPYFGDIPALLREADFAVCRAGASTIAELSAFACPSVLIPLKIAADDHQRANAEAFAARGDVKVMSEDGASVSQLSDLIEPWIEDRDALQTAHAALLENRSIDAADRIVDEIETLLTDSKFGDLTP